MICRRSSELLCEDVCPTCGSSVSVVPDKKWTELDAEQHRAHAMRLLDSLEVTAREKRLKVARAILYMAQGEFKVSSLKGFRENVREQGCYLSKELLVLFQERLQTAALKLRCSIG